MPKSTIPAADTGLPAQPSRRALLAKIPAAAIGIATTAPLALAQAAEGQDPIFAMIEEQRRLELELIETADREEDDSPVTDAAIDRAGDAFAALIRTVPQSKEGVAALANYFVDFPHRGGIAPVEEEVFICMRSIAASPTLKV